MSSNRLFLYNILVRKLLSLRLDVCYISHSSSVSGAGVCDYLGTSPDIIWRMDHIRALSSVTSATGRDRRLSAADTIENDFGVLNSGLEHRTVASTKIDKIGVSLTVETGTFRHEACHWWWWWWWWWWCRPIWQSAAFINYERFVLNFHSFSILAGTVRTGYRKFLPYKNSYFW